MTTIENHALSVLVGIAYVMKWALIAVSVVAGWPLLVMFMLGQHLRGIDRITDPDAPGLLFGSTVFWFATGFAIWYSQVAT